MAETTREFWRRARTGLALVPVLLLALAGTAGAASPTAASAPAAATPALTHDQITHLLTLLRDPKAREQFISLLEALDKASPAATAATTTGATTTAAPAKPTAAPASKPAAKPVAKPAAKSASAVHLPLAPNSLGAMLLSDVSRRVHALTSSTLATVEAVTSFPLLKFWFTATVQDTALRQLLFEALWKLFLVMVAGTAVEWLVRRSLQRSRNRVSGAAEGFGRSLGDGADETAQARAASLPPIALLLWRAPFVLGRLFLDLVPVVAFWLIATFLSTNVLNNSGLAQLVVLAIVDAYVVVRVVMSATRMLVSPDTPALRLIHVNDATAHYLVRWVRRIAAVVAFGFAGIEVGVLFGLYPAAKLALVKLVMLVVYIFVIIIILQRRRAVAGWIRGQSPSEGVFGRARVWAARVWHIVAIFYVMALWLVWAIGLPNGFGLLLRIFLLSVVVLTLARVLTVSLRDALDRWILEEPALAEGYPILHDRLRHYHPALRSGVSAIITIVAALLLLEVWGVGTISWLVQGRLGPRVAGAIGTIGFTLLVALLVWEVMNTGIQRHLGRLAAGAKAARAARLRTLLPMLRSVLLVIIAVIVGLITLSEIGVNIGPLLAGAGVIGLAIGFGSQKLVQDLITGLFLLLEDAMQVGDVVSLGGLSGVVENLSVRTIRLRSLDGSMHVIPFSAVTTVTNMTRDFSQAVLNVEVGYKENTDRVVEILKEVVHAMRNEPAWEDMIKDDLEILGVDQFAASGVVILCRIKTVPSGRWAVAREANRRIKMRFDADGIEIPYTYQRLTIDPAEWRAAFGPEAQPAGMAAMSRPAAD